MIDLAEMTPQSFEALVGRTLTVADGAGDVTMALDNIKLFSEATKRDNHLVIDGRVLPARRAFALTLEGPREPVLPARVRRVSFPDMGAAEVYVSPFRQDHNCTLYEIVFN